MRLSRQPGDLVETHGFPTPPRGECGYLSIVKHTTRVVKVKLTNCNPEIEKKERGYFWMLTLLRPLSLEE